jgi:hypothetical protein
VCRRAAAVSGEIASGAIRPAAGIAFVSKERRMMRKRIGWWLLVLALVAAPGAARAQDLPNWCAWPRDGARPPAVAQPPAYGWVDRWCAAVSNPAPARPSSLDFVVRGQDSGEGYYVPPEPFVGPLSHPRYEDGGFFTGAEFLFWRESRPILSQSVALRGFTDLTGQIGGIPGRFIGSGQEALNTNQVQGPGSYQPGLNAFVGYRFPNGVSVTLEWWHLEEARYAATAGLLGADRNVGPNLENTFLWAPVVNFPLAYAGAFASVLVGGVPAVGATFGIWNAASNMSERFLQRFELFQLNTRVPVWETESGYRAYGLFGPRAIILWEEYEWRTVQADVLGQSTNATVANYTNIASNRLYGAYCGSGHECYLGSSPIGAFSIDLSINGGLYLDFVKERAGYELGDKSTAAHRSKSDWTLVPGIDGKLGIIWYPYEAIQCRVGYNFMALFNTMASRRPIDFNMGTIDPTYSSYSRLFQGIDIGLALIF